MKDGKICTDGLKSLAAKRFGDDEKMMATLTEIWKQCENIEDGDRCELATKYMECTMNEASNHGIDPKTGLKQ